MCTLLIRSHYTKTPSHGFSTRPHPASHPASTAMCWDELLISTVSVCINKVSHLLYRRSHYCPHNNTSPEFSNRVCMCLDTAKDLFIIIIIIYSQFSL